MNKLFSNTKDTIVASNRILYTPSFFAKSSLLHLQEIGELTAKRPHVSSPTGLRSYLFFTVVNGSGMLHYQKKRYNLNTGDCVFINCQKAYSHMTTPDDLWSLRWVHFYGPAMTSIHDKYVERGGRPVFTVPSLVPVNTVWTSLMEVAQGNDYLKDMLINQHLSTLLTIIMSESWHPEDRSATPKRKSVGDVREFLDNHSAEKISLDSLATKFYVDKYYLTKIFKKQYGVSITAYIQQIRITKAKHLLRFSDMTVENIGYEVGIGTPTYFSRVFKEVEGVSPKQYREQW